MKIAIIYVSKHGTTEKVANSIADKLKADNEVDLYTLKNNTCNIGIDGYEMIILGSSIYMGQAAKDIKAFCQTNESGLLQKKIGLFVCGMHPDKAQQEKELKDAYPEALSNKAIVTGFMGGEFLFEEMNFFERFIAKKIAKTNNSVSQINWETVEDFVSKL